ncbi:MAG TPA: hypothetical protein VFK70_04130 [Vicinamibacteria bacterium]|nr:hypothetical protein [Vicinamibacteria bacterium]
MKDLAAEEVPPDSLAAVRVRVAIAAAETRPRHRGQVPAWAAAAAIVVALGSLAWVVALVSGKDPARTAVSVVPSSVPSPKGPSPEIPSRAMKSTIPGRRPVSPRMEQARRGPVQRRSIVPALSPDDADQLARAVVAIARIERVEEAPADAEPSRASAPLMRLATADPDVVIYWQLEPSGGE